MTMNMTNTAVLKAHLSEYLSMVEHGKSIEVCRRNKPIAKIIPIEKSKINKTKLNCGKGTVTFIGDLTESLIPESNWEMCK